MKTLYKIIVAFIILLGTGSCNYLDIVPDNVATIDYSFRNRTACEKYLFTCYSYRPAIGAVDNDPAMSGGDETFQRYTSIGIWPTFAGSNIARGFQSVTSPILNFWDGENSGKPLWNGIRDCNIFLENVDKVQDLPDYDKKQWIAEVKFLKAYYHYFLFKAYGPIPINDKNISVASEGSLVQVFREPVDSVVTYITNLMKEASADLPNVADQVEGTDAGRITKIGALTTRAEVLLFAASPLFNGNSDYASMIDKRGKVLFPQTYDAKKWHLAAVACKEAIDLCAAQGKALYDLVDPLVSTSAVQFQLQTTIRQAICDRWNKELIWGGTNNDNGYLAKHAAPRLVRFDPATLNNCTAEWAPTLKMAEQFYSINGVPINEDTQWQTNGWYDNRYKIRPEVSAGAEIYFVQSGQKTAYLHYNREPRFYADLGFDRGVYYGDGYYNFPSNVKNCDFLNLGVSGWQGGSGYSTTGYAAKKMHSFKNAQTTSSTSTDYFPFPIYRLANLYLMYAEALNEDTGPSDEVLTYLDRIRARAGLQGVKVSWLTYSNKPNKPDSKEGLRDIIHQERTIELAFEGKRFWDIRRWKQIDALNDQPKGWNVLGTTQDDFYKVTLVAQVPVEFTVKDYFWPIKEADLAINKNLLQNYGW